MTSVTALDAVMPLASVTITVIGKLPACVGVPLSNPVEAPSVRPSGSEPLLSDQANGDVPFVTVS